MIDITLASNALTVDDVDSGLSQAFGGGTIQDVQFTVSKERQTIGPFAPGKNQFGQTVPYVAPTPVYIMVIIFKPGMGDPLRFRLTEVRNVNGAASLWSNDLAGAQLARADIISIATP